MATINDSVLTLLDQIKRTDPNGAIARIIESLTQRNAILEDAMFVEGNLPTGHRFTSRTALPSVAWRRFNEGVPASKSRTNQVTEDCGMLEGKSTVDVDLAQLNGNEAAFRASEDLGFLQALNNEMETGFFYHSTDTAPEKIMGLAPRLDATTGVAGNQIVLSDAAAAGSDQTSIWLVCWGPDSVFGIYPKGSKAGLQSIDMGMQNVEDADGNEYLAYQTNWKWKVGLCVKDYRQLVRIANIDTSAISATGTNIIEAMIRAYHQLFDPRMGRLAWYCNRTIATYLHLQARNETDNSTLSIDEIAGRPITKVLGIPVRETDAITITEAVVS